MATNRTTVIPIGIIPKLSVSIVFLSFQQGNDTHTFLHIIDNIELKLDFANLKLQIKSQYRSKKKSQLEICPKSHRPTRYISLFFYFSFFSFHLVSCSKVKFPAKSSSTTAPASNYN